MGKISKSKPLSVEDYFANDQTSLFDSTQLNDMIDKNIVKANQIKNKPLDLTIADKFKGRYKLNFNNKYQLNSPLTYEIIYEVIENNESATINKNIIPSVLRTVSEYSHKPVEELRNIDALNIAQELIGNFNYHTMSRSEYKSFHKKHNISRFGISQHEILLAFASAYHNELFNKVK